MPCRQGNRHLLSKTCLERMGSLVGSERIPQLDALRGAACLLVLVAHLNSVRGLEQIPAWFGTAGVGVFFALSGSLITRILIADRGANVDSTDSITGTWHGFSRSIS